MNKFIFKISSFLIILAITLKCFFGSIDNSALITKDDHSSLPPDPRREDEVFAFPTFSLISRAYAAEEAPAPASKNGLLDVVGGLVASFFDGIRDLFAPDPAAPAKKEENPALPPRQPAPASALTKAEIEAFVTNLIKTTGVSLPSALPASNAVTKVVYQTPVNNYYSNYYPVTHTTETVYRDVGGGGASADSVSDLFRTLDSRVNALELNTFANALESTATSTFSGAVSAPYFIGDGSLLTGIVAGDDLPQDLASTSTPTFAGLTVKQAATEATILGDITGDVRGSNALDLQSLRSVSTQVASGGRSVSVGTRNTASGYRSSAFGNNNIAAGWNSSASGYNNNVTSAGCNSSASGYRNTVSGVLSSAFGYDNDATACQTNAFGSANNATGIFSSAFGTSNAASGCRSIAFGFANTASATSSSAFGRSILVDAQGASAFGGDGTTILTNSTACSTLIGPRVGSAIHILSTGETRIPYVVSTSTAATSTFAFNIDIAGALELKQNTTNATILGDVTGNARGTEAIDVQSGRADAAQVASGNTSIAFGVCNTSNNCRSQAVGYFNTASNYNAGAFGAANTASGDRAYAFGRSNVASGSHSAAFGRDNTSSGYRSSAFGVSNSSSGYYSAVFGYGNLTHSTACQGSAVGTHNAACAARASAFGHCNIADRAQASAFGVCLCANGIGASVFGGDGTASFVNYTDCSTMIGPRASAAVWIVSSGSIGIRGTEASPTDAIIDSSGASLTDGGTWTNASDKNLKENFTEVDKDEVLAKINNLSITKWNYIREDDSTTHIGPMAQDFYAEFSLGSSDKSISTIDPAGVALVGIQALTKRVEMLEASSSAAYFSQLSIDTATTSLSSSYEFKDVLEALQSFGATVVGGIAYLKDVFVEKLTIGSEEKPAGFTIYSKEGNAFCVTVDDSGELQSDPGTCDEIESEQEQEEQEESSEENTEVPANDTDTEEVGGTGEPVEEAVGEEEVPAEEIPSEETEQVEEVVVEEEEASSEPAAETPTEETL